MKPATPVTGNASRRVLSVSLLLVAVSAAWAAVWLAHSRGWWTDAGYTHLEFARSLSQGKGFAFAGHMVYGDSSPLWVWLLEGFHLGIPDWLVAGRALAVVAAAFALLGTFWLARVLTEELGRPESFLFASVTLLVVALNPEFCRWAFSGEPAVAAAGLGCWGLGAVRGKMREPIPPSRLILGCACAGAAPLLRPEMAIFTLLLGAALFLRWVNSPLHFRTKLTCFFAGLVLVAAPSLAWSLYALHAFGTVIPVAYAASAAGPGHSSLRGLVIGYGLAFPVLFVGTVVLTLWILSVFRRRSGDDGRRLWAALDASGWLAFVWASVTSLFLVAHHARTETRYLLVSAPALTAALLAVARKLWAGWYRAAVAAGVVLGLGTSLLLTWPALSAATSASRTRAALAALVQKLPSNAPVATAEAGELAFLSGHPVIDMSGRTRPAILPFRWDGADNRRVWWVHEQGARYLVLDHAPEPGATRIWTTTLPDMRGPLGFARRGTIDVLTLWKLPPSPTLPVSPDMAAGNGD